MTIDTDLLILEELERINLGKEAEFKFDVISKCYKKKTAINNYFTNYMVFNDMLSFKFLAKCFNLEENIIFEVQDFVKIV